MSGHARAVHGGSRCRRRGCHRHRRRVQILLDNGYHAVRETHNPFGPAFYEACDELGMLVIEEAFDEWVVGRMDFGQHITFEDRWERELEDTIRRDYSHTSIIMWSTGNQALNMAYDTFAEGRDLWGPGTEGDFAPLNVAGYNYKVARYEYDGENFRTGSSTALRPTPGPRCKAVRPSSAAPRDRRFCLKTGRDVLQTAGETAALVMVAVPAISGDGDDLAFVAIRPWMQTASRCSMRLARWQSGRWAAASCWPWVSPTPSRTVRCCLAMTVAPCSRGLLWWSSAVNGVRRAAWWRYRWVE